MPKTWVHHVMIITGASSGIGKALAYLLAPQSPQLVLVARDGNRLEEVAKHCKTLGASTLVVPTDVSNPQACLEMIQSTMSTVSKIDVLVNKADIVWQKLIVVDSHVQEWG